MKKSLMSVICLILLATAAHANWESDLTKEAQRANWEREKRARDAWCRSQGGRYKSDANGPLDCVTTFHAIKMDYSDMWYEMIEQSLYYARETGLRAGILLVVRFPEDMKYVGMLKQKIAQYNLPITPFYVTRFDQQEIDQPAPRLHTYEKNLNR